MKRYIAVLLSLSLLASVFVSAVIPAYAAAPYDADWIPPVPDFIAQANGTVSVQGKILDAAINQNEELSLFWSSVGWNRPFIVLLDQGVYNKYNEEHGIAYDKQFSIYVVCPDKKSDDTYYDFGVFEHTGGPQHVEQMVKPSPMTYMCLQNPHSFMKYIYDPENSGSWVLQPTVSHLPGGDGSKIGFTYVLAAGFEYDFLNTLRNLKNGSFSEPSEIYPYFTQLQAGILVLEQSIIKKWKAKRSITTVVMTGGLASRVMIFRPGLRGPGKVPDLVAAVLAAGAILATDPLGAAPAAEVIPAADPPGVAPVVAVIPAADPPGAAPAAGAIPAAGPARTRATRRIPGFRQRTIFPRILGSSSTPSSLRHRLLIGMTTMTQGCRVIRFMMIMIRLLS